MQAVLLFLLLLPPLVRADVPAPSEGQAVPAQLQLVPKDWDSPEELSRALAGLNPSSWEADPHSSRLEEESGNSEQTIQAFLVEPATTVDLDASRPARPCSEVQAERRQMLTSVKELSAGRHLANTRLTAFERKANAYGLAAAAPERKRLDETLDYLNDRITKLNAFAAAESSAKADRLFTYRFQPNGKVARDLAASYDVSPGVRLLRVFVPSRRWYSFPTEEYGKSLGILGLPTLESDGLTWRLQRNLNPYQACVQNTGFSLEFQTQWKLRQPGVRLPLRTLTVRTHAWMLGG